MPLNPNISLSTASIIEDSIQRTVEQYSTVNTMGSLINNAKFKRGYDEFIAGNKNEQSYIWEALSAVSEKLGQSLYQNVKDYIDNVSNVDICKVRALKSMMFLIGSDYNILDKIGYYPIEIQNLIDILSINKKYLFSSKYIKKDFLESVKSDGIVQILTPQQQLYPPYAASVELSDESILSINAASSSYDYYLLNSQQAFDSYLSSIYGNFIYDMLEMRGTGLCSDTVLYKTGFLSGIYGENTQIEDKYLFKKKMLNVNINFNVEQVANDIDMGIDSLDNYSGGELSLLTEEFDYRKAPASGLSCLDLTTRNIFYRKQKVLEYAEFVDNMVFLPVNFSSYVEYDYDRDYLAMLSTAKHSTCISNVLSIWTEDDGISSSQTSGYVPVIISSYVDYTAASLAQITKYIAKIRETIKLEARKIFMKGTNNLLKYTANEFLIDYINQLKSSMPYDKISAFVEKLSAHNIEDVIIQEYDDLTEYMNLSTLTTKYSSTKQLVNYRFFDQTFHRMNDALVPDDNNIFTNQQLNNFYLDSLNLKNTLFPAHSSTALMSNLSSNLYEFLSVLFDIGANTSYYNDRDKFGMKLQNNVITEEVDADLVSAKYVDQFMTSAMQSVDYIFDGSLSIGAQINDFSQIVYDFVQEAERQGISSIYDTYSETIAELCGQMDALTSEYDTLVTKTYASYFCKSDNLYCYDQYGSYLFDYFVGNAAYSNDSSYVMSSQSARDWINDDHCYTFSLSSVIENLSAAYDRCYSQITSIVKINLEKLDFIDPDSADLAVEMDSIQTFVNSKIDQRTAYLQSMLQSLKDQASQAKQDYESLQSTFSSVLANLPNLPHQNFYMQGAGLSTNEQTGKSKLSGNYAIINPTEDEDDYKKHIKNSIYDAVSQARYRESTKYGTFLYVSCDTYLDEMFEISEDDSLESSIDICMQMISFVNNMSFGASTSTIRTTGTQKMTLQSIQTGLNNIKSLALPSIVDQLRETFGVIVDTSEAFGNKTCIEQIEYIIQFLNTNVTDQQFNGDVVMREYYEILSKINSVSCTEYISAKSQYEAMWTDFDTFFTDYAKGSDYMVFIPANIQSVNEFRQTKDAVALAQINEKLDEFDSRYDQLLQQFINMCTDNVIKLYEYDMKQHRYLYNGNPLEFCLEDFNDKMIVDIDVKNMLANAAAQKVVDDIQKCVEIIQDLYQKYFGHLIQYIDQVDYVEKFNEMIVPFTRIIFDIIYKLEYGDEYEYVYSKELFKNYSGLTSVATDPYYNMKNQTHPSYQIHPFMWNFVEHHSMNTVLDHMSKSIVKLDFDLLENSKALSAVDVMLGKFGNVIDVWKTGLYDFTGYSTKYEQSNHICEYTGQWNEVVGYEGAFYPPACLKYVNGSKSVDGLSEYYKHLNLDADAVMKDRINMALTEDYDIISNITSRHIKSEIYDIYKYYVDAYGNMYILYKNYHSENLTDEQKRSVCGQLWIRLADSPIAFEFTKIIDDPDTSTLKKFDGRICDICMLATGTKFIITGMIEESSSQLQSKPVYIKYDVTRTCGVGHLSFVAYNPDAIDVNESGQSDLFPKNMRCHYLGSLNVSTTEVDVVYIECNDDGSIQDQPVVHIWPINQETASVTKFKIKRKMTGVYDIKGLPVISYYQSDNGFNTYVVLLFAAQSINGELMKSEHKGLSAGTINDAEGSMFNNLAHEQMNSLDLMQDKLVLKSVSINSSQSSNSISALQLNTDMGYIPSYAYCKYENILDIKYDLEQSHQMIELLGKSKDLESIISCVNEQPDPYVTKKDLFNKYMFGRIYEDDGIMHEPGFETSVSSFGEHPYLFDDSVNIYSSWSMYQNMPNMRDNEGNVVNYVNGYYQWTISLGNRYSYEKLKSLRLFMYSTASLGRNPYVVAEMSDVINMSEKLAENEFLSTHYNNTSQFNVTTYSFMNSVFTIAVNGTQNGINDIDTYFSNVLPNIENLEYKYSTLGGGMYLQLNFKLEDVNAGGYIEKDAVRVVLVDMFDLSFYNWCHFLDPGFTFGDFRYVVNQLSGNPLLRDQLLSIDCSEYNYLSDIQVDGVQIFSTNRRLQFKLDESDVFSLSSINYYVPCLNTKYPLTFAQAFDSVMGVPDDWLKHTIRIYEPNEVFDIEVADSQILSMLNVLNMKFTDIIDDFRVYEDYYDVDIDGVANNTRFSSEDPYFYQYVHFVSEEGTTGNELSIDSNICYDVRVDGTTDVFSIRLNQMHVEPRKGEQNVDTQQFSRGFDFDAMSKSDLQKLIDNIKKFMRLYISYDKIDDKIMLYVNYQNYINSPYVKIIDGYLYQEILDNTYLKVPQDSSGLVDIVLQFKQYINGVLMGIDNVTFASYRIYNVSDDKPKFVIEKTSQLQ